VERDITSGSFCHGGRRGDLDRSTPPAVLANVFGSNQPDPCDTATSSQCVAPNDSHYIFMGTSVETQTVNAFEWALTYYSSKNSDIVVARTSSPDIADVRVSDAEYGDNNLLGWGSCSTEQGTLYGGSAANHSRWCDPQIIRWNMTYYAPFLDVSTERRYLACHEFGHTIGLRHQTPRLDHLSSCMINFSFSDPRYPNTLESHDVSHINSFYP